MAKFTEINQAAWEAWVAGRPPVVQELCQRFPVDRLYRLKPTGQRVTIAAFSEGGTLTVDVTGQFNAVAFDRQVFGINPQDLEECDLPGPDEVVGTTFTDPKDVEEYINILRAGLMGKGEPPAV